MSDPISSLQNQRVKLAYNLQTRTKARRKERKIALEGVRLINDALDKGEKPLYALYNPEQVDYDLIARLQDLRIELASITPEVMQHLSDTRQTQGIIAVCRIPQPELPASPARILILDAVREPGNMGTILRTAGAAGIELVILTPGCVDPFNPKVLRSGMGAHFRLPLVDATWQQIAGYCEDIQVYAADGNGETRYTDADFTVPHALIIGNEAHGISANARDIAHSLLQIPMATATESLNAAIAAAILLFEGQRQRDFNTE